MRQSHKLWKNGSIGGIGGVAGAVLLIALLAGGCASTPRVDVREFSAEVPTAPDWVHAGALRALRDLGLEIVSDQSSGVDGVLRTRSALGQQVVVLYMLVRENVTKVEVHVLGGEAIVGRKILDDTRTWALKAANPPGK